MGAIKQMYLAIEGHCGDEDEALRQCEALMSGEPVPDWVKQAVGEDTMKRLCSFDMHNQPEEHYEDTEIVIVDATTNGTEEEFRLVKTDGLFYLEHWDGENKKWNIVESLAPNELIQKVRA